MRFVVIESPYAGDVAANEAYAREAMLDCFNRGEAPFASHLLYTQVLDDAMPQQRKAGIDAGFEIEQYAEAVVVYTDLGISRGMQLGIERANELGKKIEYRSIR